MLKILFLEDNLNDALLIERELKRYRLRFSKKVVSNQKDFVKALADFRPDLVLSDYTLPGFDGLRAIDLVQKLAPATPIIIVTGSESEETAVECMRHGAWDYVLKNRLVQIHQAVQNAMQRQSERAQIARTQEKLELLISNLPGIVFRCKTNNNWTMEYLSEGCFAVTGYHRDELLYDREISFAELICAEDEKAVRRNIQQALKDTDNYQIEYRIEHKDGSIIWLSEQGHAIYAADQLVALEGFISDISARKKAEIALARREKEFEEQSDLLNGVFDNIPDVMGIYDTAHNIERFNKTGYEFFGKTAQDVIGKKCYEMHNCEMPCELCPAEKVFVSGKSAKVERFLPQQKIWVDARAYPIYDDQGKIVKIIEHLRDITEQKKTEELIISNQKLSNAIIKDSPLGISVRDKNGTLILYNQAWQKIWDLSAAAVESYLE
ncbi:MAG: PAS domain S-box protein, partial [Candidatus Cloacimonadales bacterium]